MSPPAIFRLASELVGGYVRALLLAGGLLASRIAQNGNSQATPDNQSSTTRLVNAYHFCPVPLSTREGYSASLYIMAPPTPSSHRPRRKRRDAASHSGTNNNLILDNGDSKSHPAFPLVSFLWAARAGVSPWLSLPLILMAVGLFRWAVGLWGYSGECKTSLGCNKS